MAKPRKVEEPAAPYLAGPKLVAQSAAPAPKTNPSKVRYLDDTSAQKLTDKIFAERKNLLRKLAQ